MPPAQFLLLWREDADRPHSVRAVQAELAEPGSEPETAVRPVAMKATNGIIHLNDNLRRDLYVVDIWRAEQVRHNLPGIRVDNDVELAPALAPTPSIPCAA